MTVFSLAKTFLQDAAGKTPSALLSCADLMAGSPICFSQRKLAASRRRGLRVTSSGLMVGASQALRTWDFTDPPKNIYNYEMCRMEKPRQVLEAPTLQTVICRLPPHGWLNLWLESTSWGRSVTWWPLMCDTIDFHSADSQTRIAPARASHEHLCLLLFCFVLFFYFSVLLQQRGREMTGEFYHLMRMHIACNHVTGTSHFICAAG